MKFDHVAIACSSINQYFAEFLQPLLKINNLTEIYTDHNQGVKVAFINLEGGTKLELVEPLSEESPITNILKKKRGGLYHICFVADPDEGHEGLFQYQ